MKLAKITREALWEPSPGFAAESEGEAMLSPLSCCLGAKHCRAHRRVRAIGMTSDFVARRESAFCRDCDAMAGKPALTARTSNAQCRGAVGLRSGASRGARDGREAKAAPEPVRQGCRKL